MKAIAYITLVLGLIVFLLGLWPLVSPILCLHQYPPDILRFSDILTFIGTVMGVVSMFVIHMSKDSK